MAAGRYPCLLSCGPYAKGLEFRAGYPSAWARMIALVRVGSRGAGNSPEVIDPLSAREAQDLYACIEWAAVQEWSNGKAGLSGISYYAMNQWQVAALRPPHLTAICPWEGAADWYRDGTHHGGILSTFWANWYDMQVKSVQHGLGERGARSAATGKPACGEETLAESDLEKRRVDFGAQVSAHPLGYWHDRAGGDSP